MIGTVGRRIERDRLALHFLDDGAGRQHVFDRHPRRQASLSDIEVAQLGDRVFFVLEQRPCVKALRDVVHEIKRRDGVGLVAEQTQEAGGGQARAFLVTRVPEVFHGEQVGRVLGREPEGVASPGADAGEGARLILQLRKPGRDDIV